MPKMPQLKRGHTLKKCGVGAKLLSALSLADRICDISETGIERHDLLSVDAWDSNTITPGRSALPIKS